jgi:heat shock protein 1/8
MRTLENVQCPGTSVFLTESVHCLGIGLRLRCAQCCVAAHVKNNAPEVIVNEDGDRKTVSWISFTETERSCGGPARTSAARNLKNTVFGVKQALGKSFDEVPHTFKKQPFMTVQTTGNKPAVQVQYQNRDCVFTPEELAGFVVLQRVPADGLSAHAI